MADKVLKPNSLRYSLMKSALLKRESGYGDVFVEKMYGVRETAGALNISTDTVRRLAKSGALPHVRFTPKGYMRFKGSTIKSFLERGVTNA